MEITSKLIHREIGKHKSLIIQCFRMGDYKAMLRQGEIVSGLKECLTQVTEMEDYLKESND